MPGIYWRSVSIHNCYHCTVTYKFTSLQIQAFFSNFFFIAVKVELNALVLTLLEFVTLYSCTLHFSVNSIGADSQVTGILSKVL